MSAALTRCVLAAKHCVWSPNVSLAGGFITSVPVPTRRWQSSHPQHDAKIVQVRCGSSTPVNLYLHNTDKYSPQNPLWIYLPPHPTPLANATDIHPLPPFLRSRPTVTIGYRWFSCGQSTSDYESPLCWPTPCHDVGFAWGWIQNHLATDPGEHRAISLRPEISRPDDHKQPQQFLRRDVYVFGSRLGAGLATSLAVNTCDPAEKFSIRGVVAHNGIYNWSMFLPEHRIHEVPTDAKPEYLARRAVAAKLADEQLQREKSSLEGWFDTPANLFDPWASTSLHWRGEDIIIRRSFDPGGESGFSGPLASDVISGFDGPDGELGPDGEPEESYDWVTDDMHPDEIIRGLEQTRKRPRLVSFRFPQSHSTLRIPKTLLLYDELPKDPAEAETTSKKHQKPVHVNSYATQTLQLAEMMRQGVRRNEVMHKLKTLYDERERAETLWLPFRHISTISFTSDEAQSFEDHDQFGDDIVNTWLSGQTPLSKPSRDWQRWMEKMATTEFPKARCAKGLDLNALNKYMDKETLHTGHILGLMEDPDYEDEETTDPTIMDEIPDKDIPESPDTQGRGEWENVYPKTEPFE